MLLLSKFLLLTFYRFAVVQGISFASSLLELFQLGPRKIYWAVSESLLRGLRRDDFIRLLQKERLVEAPLSVMLQVYSTFFLTTNAIAYFAAICSLMGSSLSLSLACVVYFDLGIDTVA